MKVQIYVSDVKENCLIDYTFSDEDKDILRCFGFKNEAQLIDVLDALKERFAHEIERIKKQLPGWRADLFQQKAEDE